jgi:CBS domain-containing protein
MLEIKKTDRASKYMSSDVFYLHEKDSLKKVVDEIERTNSYFYLVLNEKEELAGFFTIQMLLDYLVA